MEKLGMEIISETDQYNYEEIGINTEELYHSLQESEQYRDMEISESESEDDSRQTLRMNVGSSGTKHEEFEYEFDYNKDQYSGTYKDIRYILRE